MHRYEYDLVHVCSLVPTIRLSRCLHYNQVKRGSADASIETMLKSFSNIHSFFASIYFYFFPIPSEKCTVMPWLHRVNHFNNTSLTKSNWVKSRAFSFSVRVFLYFLIARLSTAHSSQLRNVSSRCRDTENKILLRFLRFHNRHVFVIYCFESKCWNQSNEPILMHTIECVPTMHTLCLLTMHHNKFLGIDSIKSLWIERFKKKNVDFDVSIGYTYQIDSITFMWVR